MQSSLFLIQKTGQAGLFSLCRLEHKVHHFPIQIHHFLMENSSFVMQNQSCGHFLLCRVNNLSQQSAVERQTVPHGEQLSVTRLLQRSTCMHLDWCDSRLIFTVSRLFFDGFATNLGLFWWTAWALRPAEISIAKALLDGDLMQILMTFYWKMMDFIPEMMNCRNQSDPGRLHPDQFTTDTDLFTTDTPESSDAAVMPVYRLAEIDSWIHPWSIVCIVRPPGTWLNAAEGAWREPGGNFQLRVDEMDGILAAIRVQGPPSQNVAAEPAERHLGRSELSQSDSDDDGEAALNEKGSDLYLKRWMCSLTMINICIKNDEVWIKNDEVWI